MAAGILVAVGSFLPWISVYTAFGSIGRSGLDGGGDGIVTLILGIGILVIGATRFLGMAAPSGVVRFVPPLLAGVIALGIAILDGINVSERLQGTSSEFASGSIGAGLWVIGVGGAMSVLAAWSGRAAGEQARPLTPAGWWRVEESDLPTLAAGKSVHLDWDQTGFVVSEVVGTPIVRFPFADRQFLVTPVDKDEVVIGKQAQWSAVLSRSTDAPSTDGMARRWNARGRPDS